MEVNSSPGLEGIEKATQKDLAREIFNFVLKKVEEGKNQQSGRRKIKSNA